MKVVKRVVTEYECAVCGTRYSSKSACKKCEALPTEERLANMGDTVRLKERRTCMMKDKTYIATGSIQNIAVVPPDEEYLVKWLRKEPDTHMNSYTISYTCPHCKERRTLVAYAPEFVVLRIPPAGAIKPSASV